MAKTKIKTNIEETNELSIILLFKIMLKKEKFVPGKLSIIKVTNMVANTRKNGKK